MGKRDGAAARPNAGVPENAQLLLPLPRLQAEAGEPCWSDANRAAAHLMDQAAFWPGGLGCIVGPAGSGKRFLARKLMPDATVIASRPALLGAVFEIELTPESTLIIEDLDRILADTPFGETPLADGSAAASEPASEPATASTAGLPAALGRELPARKALEKAVFHLFNRVVQAEARCLVTATVSPRLWPIELPDLASRLAAAAEARIQAPDRALLAAALSRRLAERGLRVEEKTARALAGLAPPSFEAIEDLAARLDRVSAVTKRRVSAALGRKALSARGGRD